MTRGVWGAIVSLPHICGHLDAKHVPSNALYYCSFPSQVIRPSTVSDYIVVYIVYICTLAEKVWTERRYLSDNVDAQH